MIRQCTKCGRFLRSDAVPTLREKLVELADGTRTIHDLMDATGCTRGTIYVALTQLRRQKGIPVKLRVEAATRSALDPLGRPLLGQRELAVGAVG